MGNLDKMILPLSIFLVTWTCTICHSDKKCPPYRKDVMCLQHINRCDSNSDCPRGQICCNAACGRYCRLPTLDIPCPVVQCTPLPYGVCSRNTYKYIGGRKCLHCPEIIPCHKDCHLPKKVGPCRSRLPRYYYDIKSKSCSKFYYGGCKGNANNFRTLKECQRKCTTSLPRFCPTVKCGPPPPEACTEDVFTIFDGIKCKLCPNIIPCEKVCSLPKKQGPCEAYFPRYYYDQKSKSCQKFIYGGCQGNANNFKTLEECQQKCDDNLVCNLPKEIGPCDAAIPRYYYNEKTQSCLKFIYGGCQGNANNFKTLEECQQKCDENLVCDLPKLPGPCKGSFPRYYFDKNTKSCKKFIYGGCKGNANNFKTLERCQQKCDDKLVCNLPKEIGPCDAAIPRYYYNEKTQSCLKFIYGGCQGNANNFKTLEECQQRCDDNLVCDLPKLPGPCKGSFPRYYFDKNTKSCKKFIYGGCKGNANNFKTLERCQQKCDENLVCNLPKKIGPCEAAIPRYYYNEKTQSCLKFIYGGCQGNANNFKTLEECQQKCDENLVCELPKLPGPCKGSFPRFYFDKNTKSCKKFIYGGCKGNANNFKTFSECLRACGSKPYGCGPVCAIYCEFGNVLDKRGCPTCRCKPDPCLKAPPCARPPPGACTEPTFRIIDGVKCEWCYKIVPCKPSYGLKCPTHMLSKYACGNYKDNCSSDSSCPKGHKCCKQDCGYRCVPGV